MDEIIFVVEEAPEGDVTARALGISIFTEADDIQSLREQIRDAVRCQFDEGEMPRIVRLRFVRHEPLNNLIAPTSADPLPGFGMWADREDMRDSADWLNRQRDASRDRPPRTL